MAHLVHGETADHAPGVEDTSSPGTFGLEPDGDGRRSRDSGSNYHQVFNTRVVTGTDHTTLTRGSRMKLYFNAGLIEADTRDAVTPPFSKPLPEESEVRLQLTTVSRATTEVRLTIPEALTTEGMASL